MICASNLKCREKFQSQDYKVIVEFDLLQREISIFNKKKAHMSLGRKRQQIGLVSFRFWFRAKLDNTNKFVSRLLPVHQH